MAGYTRRKYSGNAVQTTLSGNINSTATSITIAAYTGWPHGSEPFYIVIDPATASEEKVLVTRTGSTDTTLTVASGGRGADGTTGTAHSAGASVFPVFTSVDADEANAVASTLTTKGDVLTHTGSAHARLAAGTDGHVLTADSAQTNGIKWATYSDTTKIPLSIIDAKGDLIVGSAADTAAKLTAGTDGYVLTADSTQTYGLKWNALVATAADDANLIIGFGSFS